MSPGKVQAAWRIAVGTAVDRATAVALLEDGTLEVTTNDPAWRREVKRSQPLILSRLQDLIGSAAVKKIRVVARPVRK